MTDEIIWMKKPGGEPEQCLKTAYGYALAHGYRPCSAPLPQPRAIPDPPPPPTTTEPAAPKKTTQAKKKAKAK